MRRARMKVRRWEEWGQVGVRGKVRRTMVAMRVVAVMMRMGDFLSKNSANTSITVIITLSFTIAGVINDAFIVVYC